MVLHSILKVQQVKGGNSNPPDMSGKPGTGTSWASVMHKLLLLVQEAVALLCSLRQALMLGQLSHLKVNKTEVLKWLKAHSHLKADKWVGTHLCVCKNLPPQHLSPGQKSKPYKQKYCNHFSVLSAELFIICRIRL